MDPSVDLANNSTLRVGVGARRVTEPMAKFSCEMRVVAKAAGVGDRADRLAHAQQLPAIEKVCGVSQTQRIDEFGAGQAALCKELLEVA